MSITITIRPNGAPTGGKDQTIAGDGAIDTKEEAEAALTFLPPNSTDTVVSGGKSYTRDELIAIRDQKTAPADSKDGTTAAPGMANGVALTGYYAFSGGEKGHPGPGVRLSWVPSWLVGGDQYTTHFDLPVGGEVGHFSKDYTLPGGGDANSAFTRYGARIVPTLHLVAPWADRRLSGSIGAALGIGGFSTADSNMVSTPTACIPDAFGRTDCDPKAGPRTGNAGDAGLLYPRIGSSRGAKGAYFDFGVPITLGVAIARGAWGQIGGHVGFEPGYTHLMPADGGAFGFARFVGFLGIHGIFGGSSVEIPRTPAGPSGPTDDGNPIDATGTPRTPEAMNLSAPQIRDMAGLPTGANILGVQFDNHPEDTTAPYEIQAAWMTPGDHTLKVRYTKPGETKPEYIRSVRIRVGTPAAVELPANATGSAYGVVPTIASNVSRPPLTPGVAAGPLKIGSVEVTSAVPQGAVLAVFVDGNEVGTIPLQPNTPGTDHTAPITIPAGTADGPHQIGLRIRRPGAAEVRFNDRPIAVGPATVTLTNVAPQPRPPAPVYSYTTASLVVDMKSSGEAKEVRIRTTTNKVLWTGGLAKDANSVTVIEQNGKRDDYSGVLIIEQKSGADWVEIGKTQSVEIKKAVWTGGGGGGGGVPTLGGKKGK